MLLIGQMQTIIQINVTLITRHQKGNKEEKETPGGRDTTGKFFIFFRLYKKGGYYGY